MSPGQLGMSRLGGCGCEFSNHTPPDQCGAPVHGGGEQWQFEAVCHCGFSVQCARTPLRVLPQHSPVPVLPAHPTQRYPDLSDVSWYGVGHQVSKLVNQCDFFFFFLSFSPVAVAFRIPDWAEFKQQGQADPCHALHWLLWSKCNCMERSGACCHGYYDLGFANKHFTNITRSSRTTQFTETPCHQNLNFLYSLC